MSQTLLSTRQSVNYPALPNSIGVPANSTLDSILSSIDSQMVNLSGTQTLSNKSIGMSVATDSITTGSNTTIQPFTAGIVRLTNASLASISGIPSGTSGQILVLENQTGSTVLINNDDSNATAGNRIYTGTGAVASMQNNTTFVFTYDVTASHWMLTGGNGASGSSSTLPVGTVVSSFLTLSQYQGQAGTGWVLSEGQTVSGSTYESVTGQSSLTASQNASSTVTGASLIFSTPSVTTTGNTTNASNTITNIPLNTSIAVGQIVGASNIPTNSRVTAVSQYTFALPGTNNGYQFTVHSSTVYIFTVSAANATAGATYTNNGQTFTVTTTISGGTTLTTTGTGTPTASGTLTLATGTGDATITFSAFTYGGANATSGATYTNNGYTYTVTTTLTDGTSLVTTGTGVPAPSGTLTLSSGTGDSTITFTAFSYLGHNATAGATYTNNSQTFTVVTTLSDGVTLVCTGTGYPLSSGTLTLATGTGDSTISFSSVDISITMTNNATSTLTGETIIFSNYAATTSGNITSGSSSVTNLANTTGLATGQIINSPYFSYNTTVSTLSVTTVPDCRGLFLRGKNNGRNDGNQNPDGDVTPGTLQDDTMQRITGTFSGIASDIGGPFTGPFTLGSQYSGTGENAQPNWNANFDTSLAARTSTETRARNVTVNYFIRIN